MPTYLYRCNDCSHEFDTVQSMMDDPLTECPKCGGAIRRVIQASGIQFKGTGFYVTDSSGGKSE